MYNLALEIKGSLRELNNTQFASSNKHFSCLEIHNIYHTCRNKVCSSMWCNVSWQVRNKREFWDTYPTHLVICSKPVRRTLLITAKVISRWRTSDIAKYSVSEVHAFYYLGVSARWELGRDTSRMHVSILEEKVIWTWLTERQSAEY